MRAWPPLPFPLRIRPATSGAGKRLRARLAEGEAMAELYVKPGNRERGWNDPPQFSYGLQQLQASGAGGGGGGGKRGILTRRPAAAPGAAPPPPPPHGPGEETLRCFSFLFLSFSFPISFSSSSSSSSSVNRDYKIKKQVCDDISKRLGILQQMWVQGKLSAPVRKGMKILTQELKKRHWDAADEIHRSLIVDHVTEVSQWMVGVKRLIAETRNLHTEDLATEDYEQKVETSLEPECQ
uniref:Steroid receptor RNA activator 1 n=1 Tax=Podarcis muralis TaxID=64176 RepID=A0A670IMV0_PODMU